MSIFNFLNCTNGIKSHKASNVLNKLHKFHQAHAFITRFNGTKHVSESFNLIFHERLPQKECFGSLARASRAFLIQCEVVRMI